MAAEEQTVLPAKIIDSPADWPVGSTFWPGIDISPICPSPLCGRRVWRHFLAVLEHHGQKKQLANGNLWQLWTTVKKCNI